MQQKKKNRFRDTCLTIIVIVLLGCFLHYAQNHFNGYAIQIINLVAVNAILALSMNIIYGFTGMFSLGQAGFMAIGAYVSALCVLTPEQKEMMWILDEIIWPFSTIHTSFFVSVVAGGLITDFKIGYWIGTTPRKQETWKFVGVVVAAATVSGVMMILNKTFGFSGEGALVAPQANAMAAVIQPMMNGGNAPWLLYGIGALIAVLLTLFKVPALAFCLGMFIPLDLNLPLLLGGAISWFVSTRSKDASVNAARQEKGTLVASGFIAGGALMGVLSAILKFAQVDWFLEGWNTVLPGRVASNAQAIAILPLVAICAYMIYASMRRNSRGGA